MTDAPWLVHLSCVIYVFKTKVFCHQTLKAVPLSILLILLLCCLNYNLLKIIFFPFHWTHRWQSIQSAGFNLAYVFKSIIDLRLDILFFFFIIGTFVHFNMYVFCWNCYIFNSTIMQILFERFLFLTALFYFANTVRRIVCRWCIVLDWFFGKKWIYFTNWKHS